MTDNDRLQLKKRIKNGKAWIENLKAQGKYWAPDTREHILLWCRLVDLALSEDQIQSVEQKQLAHEKGLIWFGRAWHSPAWVGMRKREIEQDDKREREREKRRERKERIRSNPSQS